MSKEDTKLLGNQLLKLNVGQISKEEDRKIFFSAKGHGIARYDVVNHDIFLKLDAKMKGFYWRAVEIDVSREKNDFDNNATEEDRFVFTSNLKRQIVLDTVQGRAPTTVFLPHCTDPALENCITTWAFFETIHSESYTHIIRAIYSDPKVIFDDLPNISEIVDCASEITEAYENCIVNPTKENLWLALMAANALEAIRFYVSFICTFSFLERGIFEGSAKIVKMIARDENEHLALVQHILKTLVATDPEFAEISVRCKDKAIAIFKSAAEQEKNWVKYLFSRGPILILSEQTMIKYIDEYLVPRRMNAAGLSNDKSYKGKNPFPWSEKHFSNAKTQVAPQEVELASYVSSSLNNNLNNEQISDNLTQLWENEVEL